MHEFWSHSKVYGKLIATCRHDFTNKYLTATRALVGGVFRLLEILPLCVVQNLEFGTVTNIRMYAQILVTFKGSRKINCYISTWYQK